MNLLMVVLAIVFAVMAFASCIAANVCVFAMVEDINKLLPAEKQYSPMWWYPGKLSRLRGDYRRLHPQGSLSRYMIAAIVIMGISFLTALAIIIAISPNTTR